MYRIPSVEVQTVIDRLYVYTALIISMVDTKRKPKTKNEEEIKLTHRFGSCFIPMIYVTNVLAGLLTPSTPA